MHLNEISTKANYLQRKYNHTDYRERCACIMLIYSFQNLIFNESQIYFQVSIAASNERKLFFPHSTISPAQIIIYHTRRLSWCKISHREIFRSSQIGNVIPEIFQPSSSSSTTAHYRDEVESRSFCYYCSCCCFDGGPKIHRGFF